MNLVKIYQGSWTLNERKLLVAGVTMDKGFFEAVNVEQQTLRRRGLFKRMRMRNKSCG